MKKLQSLLFALLFTMGASAQLTSVTATVTDSDSTVWTSATVTATFVPNPNFPNLSQYTIAGVPITSVTYSQYLNQTVTSDPSTGAIAITLLDNQQVSPAGSLWQFNIKSNTSAPATSYNPVEVYGSSYSLSSFLSSNSKAPRFSAAYVGAYGYADIEVSTVPLPGGQYFNTSSGISRQWTGTVWQNFGGGGGGGATLPFPGLVYGTSANGGTVATSAQVVTTLNNSPTTLISPAVETAVGNVWQREGTIISPNDTEEFNASEPTLIYEPNPQILSGITSGASIFKLWWNCGYLTTGLCYAESVDGENWTRAANPVIARVLDSGVAHGYVFHYGSTYYYYGANGVSGNTGFDEYTSSDGITWTLAHSNVITLGSGGSWDSTGLGNIYVIPSSGTWLAMYEANGATGPFRMGVASSADQGVTWTKYSGNPVLGSLSSEAGGPEIHLVGSTYYVWYTCNNTGAFTPTDICRAHASTFLGTWTPDNGGNPVLTRSTADEGQGINAGQIADPSMQQVGNSIYMVYDGVLAQNGTTPDAFHLKLANAQLTFAQLVATDGGDATNYHANGSFGSLNLSTCVYWDNNFNRVPCPNTTGQFLVGTFDLQGGIYPSLSFNQYWNGSATNLITNGYAEASYLDVAAGLFHAQISNSSGSAGTAANASDYMTVQGGATTPISWLVSDQHKFANPQSTWWETGTGSKFSVGVYTNYGYLSEPGGTGFFSFTGFGSSPVITMQANAFLGFAATNTIFAAPDTGISRVAAGVLSVDSSTAGNQAGILQLAAIRPKTYIVSGLPSASAIGAGGMVTVTDASTFTVGTCTGGGSDTMIAVSNGTSWSCH